MNTLIQDLRYALRGMRKSPGFTAVAVVCLALGIGANTAIFTVINAVLIRSLPVSHPERLVLFTYTAKGKNPYRRTSSGYGNTSLSYATFEALRPGGKTLSGAFAFVPLGFNNQSVTVGAGGEPTLAGGEMVSGGYFPILGVSAVYGRTITDEDLKPGAPNVAVLSFRYWSRQFGGERSAVGRSIAINAQPFTIVGVTPPEFFGVDPQLSPDIWVPMREMTGIYPWGVQPRGDRSMFGDKGWWWCMMMGRLAPGATTGQASAELDVIFHHSITEGSAQPVRPEDLPHLNLAPANRGLDHLRSAYSEPLRILMAAVGLVLLIACANVATLLLARANSRQKEMGMRLAIGATRARLIRQFLTESVLLALGGGALGVLLARWGSQALVLVMSSRGQTIGLDLHPDAAVLAFSAAASTLTGILFGMAPAFRATRVDPAVQLKQGTVAAAGRFSLAKVLVACQVAFSVILLFGASLFVRTLRQLENQDLGFNRNNLLLFALDPRVNGYKGDRLVARYNEFMDKLRAAPGVRSATASAYALLSGWVNNGPAWTDGTPIPQGRSTQLNWNIVGPDFLETMGIRLVLGRGIERRDLQSDRRVAVVNETTARYFFPGENPVGRHFSFGNRFDAAQAYEIVGVAHDAKFDNMRNEPPRTAYVPYSAVPPLLGKLYFEVRTPGDPTAILPAVRQAVRAIDASLPLIDVKTQSDQIAEALSREHMFARLTSFFGSLALLLVSIGVYGTLAYAVTRRTSEIGIRVALGARRGRVLWMVLRESVLVVACGLVLGLPAAFAATRFVASMLFGVKPYDTAAIAATVLILAAAGAAAGLVPAYRASRIDPMRALRYE